jgi:geranylgeranyl pyrophosphate synthase
VTVIQSRQTDAKYITQLNITTGGYNEECKRASYLYGTYVGQAFQLIDDALDFEGGCSLFTDA